MKPAWLVALGISCSAGRPTKQGPTSGAADALAHLLEVDVSTLPRKTAEGPLLSPTDCYLLATEAHALSLELEGIPPAERDIVGLFRMHDLAGFAIEFGTAMPAPPFYATLGEYTVNLHHLRNGQLLIAEPELRELMREYEGLQRAEYYATLAEGAAEVSDPEVVLGLLRGDVGGDQ